MQYMLYLPGPSFGVLLSPSAIIQLYQDYPTCWERKFGKKKKKKKLTDETSYLVWVSRHL